MTKDDPRPEFDIPSLRAAVGERCARAKLLAQQADKLRKLFEAVAEAWPERPALTNALLTRERTTWGDLEEGDPVRGFLARIAQQAPGAARSALSDLVRRMPDALQARGLTIDASSRHPRYSLHKHLLELELQPEKLVAIVRPRHGDVIREPLDPEAVVDVIYSEYKRLTGRVFEAEKFAGDLEKAVKTIDGGEGGVPVREAAHAMVKSTKARLDEFAVDLGRLLSEPASQKQASRFSVEHTRDTSKGLMLLGLETGGYVGSISLRRAS